MKKLTVLLLLLLFLTSCAPEKDIKETLSLPLEIGLSLLPNGSEFTASIDENGCRVHFKAECLQGLSLYFSESGARAEIEGYFEREVEQESFPAISMLYKSLVLLDSYEGEGEKIENRIKYTIDETAIMVYYDKATERITHIETEEKGRRFLFTVTSLLRDEAQSNGAG